MAAETTPATFERRASGLVREAGRSTSDDNINFRVARLDGGACLPLLDGPLSGREPLPDSDPDVPFGDPDEPRVRVLRGLDAALRRRLRVREPRAAPRARDDVELEQHGLVVHLRRRPLGVLRAVRARAALRHGWADGRCAVDDGPGVVRHVVGDLPRRDGTDRVPRRGVLPEPPGVLPVPERRVRDLARRNRPRDARVALQVPRRHHGVARRGARRGRAPWSRPVGEGCRLRRRRSVQPEVDAPGGHADLHQPRFQPVLGLHRLGGEAREELQRGRCRSWLPSARSTSS